MDSHQVLLLLIGIVVIGAVVLGLLFYLKNQRTEKLRRRFGPEYERTVIQFHDHKKAEAELARRQKRVENFHLRNLPPEEQARYSATWRQVQADFVDSPSLATTQADQLLSEVMTARGYPEQNFEQAATDLSVHYPRVVQDYREAHEIMVRHRRDEATTEDLRRAMVSYRAIFQELLNSRMAERDVA
jgi:hypothetical protein